MKSATTGSAAASRRDPTRAAPARSARAVTALTTVPSLRRGVREHRPRRLAADERAVDAGVGAALDDPLQTWPRRVGDRDGDGIRPHPLENRSEVGRRSEHRDAENAATEKSTVVVDQSDDLFFRRLVELPDQAPAAAAGSDDERPATRSPPRQRRQRLGKGARTEPGRADRERAEHRVDREDTPREARKGRLIGDGNQRDGNALGEEDGGGDPHGVAGADVPPDA